MNIQVKFGSNPDEFSIKSQKVEFNEEQDFIPSDPSDGDILQTLVTCHNEEKSRYNILNAENNVQSNNSYDNKEGTCHNLQEARLDNINRMSKQAFPQDEEGSNDFENNSKDVEGDLSTTSSDIIFEDKLLAKSDMLICCICYRVFSTPYKLDSHLRRVHKHTEMKNFSKPKMQKKNDNNDWPPNVQNLARRVNGAKMFFCNLCTYNVNRCDSMSKHMIRVHNEGRIVPEHQCEICGKTFIDKGYLRNHSVSHLTERLYRCHVCGLDFHRQASLKRHIQSHSEEKQFSCTLCEYQTNRKHLMYRHAEQHRSGRAYSCRLCNAQFFTQLSFRSHMYNHNTTLNCCSLCKVNFSSRERMLCHMKRVHFSSDIKVMDITSVLLV